MSVTVDMELWRDISDFFSAIVAPCKECLRGNPVKCWEAQCAAFRFRGIARRIKDVNVSTAELVKVPHFIVIENEIIEKLSLMKRPVRPKDIRLRSTNNKVDKCHAIKRLIKKGIVKEIVPEKGSRLILLHTKWESKK